MKQAITLGEARIRFPQQVAYIEAQHAKRRTKGGTIPLDQYEWRVRTALSYPSTVVEWLTAMHGRCWFSSSQQG